MSKGIYIGVPPITLKFDIQGQNLAQTYNIFYLYVDNYMDNYMNENVANHM